MKKLYQDRLDSKLHKEGHEDPLSIYKHIIQSIHEAAREALAKKVIGQQKNNGGQKSYGKRLKK
jgi:hypothetical protein